MKEEIILLPCPFCGGAASFDFDDDGWNWIECSQCHVSSKQGVSAMEDCKPILAEAWNMRCDMPLSLEKHYANSLGELARLSDGVCQWVLGSSCNCPPDEVEKACFEIMEYVDAVRP